MPVFKLSNCLLATLLLTATPMMAETAEELLTNPDVIATCAAKGAVPDTVTRLSKTEVSVTCMKPEQQVVLSGYGTKEAAAAKMNRDVDEVVEEDSDSSAIYFGAPAIILPAVLLALLAGSGASSGTN